MTVLEKNRRLKKYNIRMNNDAVPQRTVTLGGMLGHKKLNSRKVERLSLHRGVRCVGRAASGARARAQSVAALQPEENLHDALRTSELQWRGVLKLLNVDLSEDQGCGGGRRRGGQDLHAREVGGSPANSPATRRTRSQANTCPQCSITTR